MKKDRLKFASLGLFALGILAIVFDFWQRSDGIREHYNYPTLGFTFLVLGVVVWQIHKRICELEERIGK